MGVAADPLKPGAAGLGPLFNVEPTHELGTYIWVEKLCDVHPKYLSCGRNIGKL